MYVSLSQPLEMIQAISAKIRMFYNFPEKLFVDEMQADLSESVVSPSDLNKEEERRTEQETSAEEELGEGDGA